MRLADLFLPDLHGNSLPDDHSVWLGDQKARENKVVCSHFLVSKVSNSITFITGFISLLFVETPAGSSIRSYAPEKLYEPLVLHEEEFFYLSAELRFRH